MGSRDPGALHWGCQPVSHLAIWLLPCCRWGFSVRRAYEHREPLLYPNTEQPQQCVLSVLECNSERREWDRRSQEEFPSQGNRHYE